MNRIVATLFVSVALLALATTLTVAQVPPPQCPPWPQCVCDGNCSLGDMPAVRAAAERMKVRVPDKWTLRKQESVAIIRPK